MAKVSGQVFKVYDKQWAGKVLFTVKLEGDPIYYRMNENRGAGIVESGNWIEFDAEPNADGKSATVKSKPTLLPRPVAAAAPAAATGAVNLGGGREASIHYQSSRKDALAFLDIVVAHGAVVLPVKASARLKALEALVDYYTALYFEDIATGGAVSRSTQAAYAAEEGDEKPVKKGKAVRKVNEDVAADEDEDDDGDDE